ncbi:MAG: hypothetical protein ACC662_08340, partial [Planctomycetota bacterium]
MRQLQQTQRGSANWPFIIALLLAFVFIYLWFTEKDEREQAQIKAKQAETAEQLAMEGWQVSVDWAREASNLIGWNDKPAMDLVTNPKVKPLAQRVSGDVYVTDLEKLKVQLTPDGKTENGDPGLLNYLLTQAQMEIRGDLRTKQAEGVTETEVKFDWMTPAFRAKLAEINAMEIPVAPQAVVDPDDAADVTRYESEKGAYDQAVQRWQQAFEELATFEGYEEFSKIIKGPGKFDPDTQRVIKLQFFSQPATGEVTVMDLVTYPPLVVENVKKEFAANKIEDTTTIDNLKQSEQGKDASIADLQSQLADEQQRHTQDVEQLRGELATANETIARTSVETTEAKQELAQTQDKAQTSVAERDATISALENRIRLDKQKRDLEIRRNDPDGEVLSANPTMQTAVINLGHKDKVYPGLVFAVSRIGKGGIRVAKGTVQVTKVLGDHAAKVAILDILDPIHPVLGGDLIANPFYSPKEPVHVWIVGELQKYPTEIANARLAKLHVITDKTINEDTDYVIVPNAMAAPP